MALIKNKISVLSKQSPESTEQTIRVNGLSDPFHWLQIIAWLFVVLISVICFTFIVPTLPSTPIRCTVVVIKLLVIIIHFITHIKAITINPADDAVIDKLDVTRNRPKFDRNKHSHVIENQFCYICETTVGSKSKHCSLCNKCVSNFDHHCKWLNNCVGGKNYRWFIYCVLSALLGIAIIFVNTLILTIAYFNHNSWLYDRTKTLLYFNNDSHINQCLQIVWIVVIISTLILSSIAIILLTHLLGFHLYLNCVGLSTYEFVVQHRNKQKDKSFMSRILNGNQRNKLVTSFHKWIGIAICDNKRIKPLDPTIYNSTTHSSKASKDRQFIQSIIKDVSNEEHITSQEISTIMKCLETVPNKEVQTENNTIVKASPINQQKSSRQLSDNFSQNNANNGKNIISVTEENHEKNQMITSVESNESFNETKSHNQTNSQPILKPIEDSKVVTNRLSFLSPTDFVIPDHWTQTGFMGPSSPSNKLHIRYNTYKLNDNFRLNSLQLHRNRLHLNKNNNLTESELISQEMANSYP
ncbi:palmitoyltransferase ZDHHC1-like, partial [Oppia nitens]|uniref:palmitoyltransferase ZDHHC1-like n=1 Tax=Oppia nitens TaxID=1686743 RepID=UPI0023DCD8EE